MLPFGVLAILSDILIAAALCLLLANNRSEFDDTNTVVNRLIVYAINRCVLTSYVLMFINTSSPKLFFVNSAIAVIEVVIVSHRQHHPFNGKR